MSRLPMNPLSVSEGEASTPTQTDTIQSSPKQPNPGQPITPAHLSDARSPALSRRVGLVRKEAKRAINPIQPNTGQPGASQSTPAQNSPNQSKPNND